MCLEAAVKPWICFSVSLICFTSCAVAGPGSNRARARSAENDTPRNPRRVDTAYPFRMSDMAWSSISIHRLHPTILAAAWRNHTDADVRRGSCDQGSGQSGQGASEGGVIPEWCRDSSAIAFVMYECLSHAECALGTRVANGRAQITTLP